MNTKALNALADVICRAQEQDRTPMGIAFAVDSAGLHMSPETAAELEQLRAQVAALLEERHSTNEALDDAVQALRVHRDRVAELASRLRAGQTWQKGRTPALVSQDLVSQDELRAIFGIPLEAPWADGIARRIVPVQALREDEPAKASARRTLTDDEVAAVWDAVDRATPGHIFRYEFERIVRAAFGAIGFPMPGTGAEDDAEVEV